MKFQDANLQVDEKSSFKHSPSYTLPSFSKNTSRDYFFQRVFESERAQFLSDKGVACNLHVQLQFLQVNSMLKMQLGVFLSIVFIK